MSVSNSATFDCPNCGFTKRVIHFADEPRTPVCDKCQVRMVEQ